jgi:hypothetical protein
MFVIRKRKLGLCVKEIHRQALGLKNLWNIYKLACGFCFFVTPTSVFQTLFFMTKSSLSYFRLLEGGNHPETVFLNL